MFIEALNRSGCLPRQLHLAQKRKITEFNRAKYFNACKKTFATTLCLKKPLSMEWKVLSYSRALWYRCNPPEKFHQRETGVRYDPDWNGPWADQAVTLSSVLLCHVNQQREDLPPAPPPVCTPWAQGNYSVNFVPIVQQHQYLRAR